MELFWYMVGVVVAGALFALGLIMLWYWLVFVALVDLVRYSLYILVGAVIIQVVVSWINPYTPVAPVLDALTRPFLRPLRRYVPPVGRVDLTPMVLLVILYVALIPLNYLRLAAAGL